MNNERQFSVFFDVLGRKAPLHVRRKLQVLLEGDFLLIFVVLELNLENFFDNVPDANEQRAHRATNQSHQTQNRTKKYPNDDSIIATHLALKYGMPLNV